MKVQLCILPTLLILQDNLACNQDSISDAQRTVQEFKVCVCVLNVHIHVHVHDVLCCCTQDEVDRQVSELMVTKLMPLLQQLTQLVSQHSASIVQTTSELRDQV